MLFARPLHAFVRAPVDFKTQLAFCLPATGSAAKRLQSSVKEPSLILFTQSLRGAPTATSLALILWFSKKEVSRERWPSAAARDQHSSREVKGYLRSMLSRRQLQGFVRRRVG
jgi:hypothetical protein